MSAKEGGLDLSDNNVSRVCGTQVEGLKCGKCRSPSLLVRSGSYNNAGNVSAKATTSGDASNVKVREGPPAPRSSHHRPK